MKQSVDSTVESVLVEIFHALWSEDQRTWEIYAPGIWAQMEAALRGERAALEVVSCPQGQPFRAGTVTFSVGQATVRFTELWQEPWDLELSGEPEEITMVREAIRAFCGQFHPELGPEVAAACEGVIHSTHFPALMNAIDVFELQMIQDARERGYALGDLIATLCDDEEPLPAAA